MKRKFIFFAMMLLTLIGGVKWNVLNAQETVLIGDEANAVINSSIPFDLWSENNISQQVYTADEINHDAGVINSLAVRFWGVGADADRVITDAPGSGSFPRKVAIYINNTDLTFMPQVGQNVPEGQVANFDGEVTFVTGEWAEFTFDNPFQYEGGNILVTMYDYTGGNSGADYYYFYVNELEGNSKTAFKNSYPDTPFNIEQSTNGFANSDWRNIIKLTFGAAGGGEEPTPEQPETQEPVVVTIGDASAENTNSSANYPFCNTYKYSHTQQIYSSAVIKSYNNNTIPEGNITKIKYYIAEGSQEYFGSVKVYMRNSDLAAFTGETTAEAKLAWDKDFTADDLVFEGDVDVVDNAIEMTLKNPFAYDDTKNLIIYVDVDTRNGTTATKFRYTKTFADGTAFTDKGLLYYRNNNNNAGLGNWTTASGSPSNYLSVVSLTFAGEGGGEEPEPTPVAPATPTNVVATADGQNSIIVTWNAVEGATSYNIYTPNNYAGSNVLGLEATTYTFEGLTAGTEYCFEVAAVNDAGESDATKACATIEATEEPETPVISIIETGTDKNPNASNNFYLPVYDYSAYAMSQQIYTAEELGGATGKIHSVAFKLGVNSRAAVTRQYEVYLTTTALNAFNGYNFITLTEADKVFDGSVEISGVVDTWYTINLDKVFDYAGGNLVLTVYDKTGVANTSNYHQFYKYSATGRALYMQGSAAYDMLNLTTGISQNYVSQVQLGMELDLTLKAPQNVVATVTSSSEIELTWDALAVAESYNVYAGTKFVANVEGTSYTVTGLDAATEYCFTVTSVNELGESAASAEACATTKMLAPATPANLAVASVGDMSVSLTWDASATAESYNVYQGETLVATGVTATEYTVGGLASETEYCFTVTAVNNGGESAKSEQACGTTLEFTGCYVYFTLNDSYGDGWNGNTLTVSYDGVPQTIGFPAVLGGKNDKTITEIVPIPQNAVVTLTYTVVGSYSYPVENGFVVAYESGKEILRVDEGALSGTVTFDAFTVDCAPGAPDAPVVTATAQDATTIVLSMESFGAETYNIYQGEELVASVTETTYTVEGLEANTGYCFSVTAENALGVSEATEACATTLMLAPEAPANLAVASVGELSIDLAWEASATAESYNIYNNTVLVATGVTATEYTVEGLASETEYCFTVSAVNNGGESAKSEQACGTTLEFTGCFVNFTLTDSYNDSWDGDSLFVSYSGGTETLYCFSGQSPKTHTLAIPQGDLVTMTFAKYSNYPQEKGIIVTYESGKEILNIAKGTLSATTSWEFVVDCTPEAPSIATVVAEATGDETVVLTMEAVGAESFNIYIGGELVATADKKVYTVEGLTPETEYCFTVEAVNEVGTSEELSEAACATTYKAGTSVVQIGEGTENYVSTSPVNEFYSYSISQTIYKAEEIGLDKGIIKSVSYNQYTGANNIRNIAIYMKNTDNVNLGIGWEALTEDMLVFEGNYTFGTTGWTEIELQEGFVYEGGNLLVCVLDKTGAYAYYYDMFYTYLSGNETVRSIYAGSGQSIDPYNINLSKNSLCNNDYLCVAPQAKFVIEPYVVGKFIGKVIDEKNNTPIAGATLKFTGKETYETTTKEDGTFDIDAVVGNYTLEISHPNYETKQLTDLEITNSGTITDLMEIELVAIATFVGGDSENPTAWNTAANWSTNEVPAAGADVIINASAVISSEVNVKSLTINGTYYDTNLTIAANGALTVTGAINQSNYQLILEEGGQIFQNNEGVTARFRMNIDNPTEWSNTNTDGWQFISMPLLDVDYAAFASTWNETTAQSTCDYDLYKYDGSQDYEWQNHRDGFGTETTFKSGTGYLASRKEAETVTVSGTLNVANPFAYRTFSYVVEDEQVKELSRIHLVGNPFTYDIKWSDFNIIGNVCNIDTDEVEEKQLFVNGFAVANGGGYKYYDPNEENSDATIKVGQGFFVKILENGASLSYQPNTRSSKEKANSINVIASGKAGKDNVVVNFAGQAEGFNKLQNFNDAIATVYVTENGKNYGIANVDENTTEVALNFDAKEMGNYTISLDVNGEFETVTLVDRFTGVETNMLLEDEYTFTATSNDNVNRFVIRLANGQEPTANSQFVYQSGEELILSIEGTVQIVDMLGRVVYYNEHANGDNRINVAEFNDAAYVVRVVNEEGVKTQKVVIY